MLFAQRDPIVPESDDQVLVVLPKSFLSNRNELASLREQLNADPENPSLAADVASKYLSMGNRTGDPRFYGYATAAIGRWWVAESTTPAILRLRSKLKEKDHRYDDALADLQILLDKAPSDAQALLEVGNIYRVQGRYDDAIEIADQIQTVAGEVPAALCRAPVMAQMGKAEQADELLRQLLPAAKENFPTTLQFIRTIQAEIADSLGRNDDVEQHFVDGLSVDSADFYLVRGYADFLLDHDRADEALELTRPHTSDTGILLRAAIAAKAMGDTAQADRWADELEMRFKEIRLRGGQPHGRFESRSKLHLRDDPESALEIALATWQLQKEVRDTRNVLEAALATGDARAAQPVIDFLKSNQNQHVVLAKLVQRLEATK